MKIFFTNVLIFLFCPLFINAQVLISEIYGGGGNTSATWNADVVQLKNIGGSTVDLTGYAIQYASAAGSSWNVDPIPSGTMIPAGTILNVILGNGGSAGSTPPTPSVAAIAAPGGIINMSATAGKVALTDNVTALTGTGCPATAIDYVGYGASSLCGPHTTSTIPSSPASVTNTQGYKRTNTAVPGSYDITLSPLPIKLIDFRVRGNGKLNNISFVTETETNNDYFNIERSVDGKTFDIIGEIKGAGNSNNLIHYSFIDENPLVGINYYRLKQTDYDGQFAYSDVKSIRVKGTKNVTVSPRSTDGRLWINTDLEDYSVEVYSSTGQVVKFFKTMSFDQSINIDELLAGFYFIRINAQVETETIKIMKF